MHFEEIKHNSVFLEELENELDDVRNQIKEKTALLVSSDLRVTNLCRYFV